MARKPDFRPGSKHSCVRSNISQYPFDARMSPTACRSVPDAAPPVEAPGLGDSHGPNPYKFIGFGASHGPNPCKFIGFGDSHVELRREAFGRTLHRIFGRMSPTACRSVPNAAPSYHTKRREKSGEGLLFQSGYRKAIWPRFAGCIFEVWPGISGPDCFSSVFSLLFCVLTLGTRPH